MRRLIVLATFAFIHLLTTAAYAVEFMPQTDAGKGRSYSPAVVTEGGRTIWLSGETAITDLNGKDIKGDFEAQVRTIFALIEKPLKFAGGSLKDIVTTTTFITDPRNGPTLSKVRADLFPEGNFPASAMITVSNLAVPGMLIEIQGVAVINDKCSKANSCINR
jgi:enamine deaminase RidA (YjgF/YER057c/UK114 family)